MNQTTAEIASPIPVNPPMLPVTVSLRDAIAWTTNWRESDHHLKATCFTFDADDFIAILHEPKVRKVRLYLGLEVMGNENNALREKLIVVGVDSKGRDMIFVSIGRDENENEGTGIYDFSNPCPPLCSQDNNSSPLH